MYQRGSNASNGEPKAGRLTPTTVWARIQATSGSSKVRSQNRGT
jgi:hypothetical protein